MRLGRNAMNDHIENTPATPRAGGAVVVSPAFQRGEAEPTHSPRPVGTTPVRALCLIGMLLFGTPLVAQRTHTRAEIVEHFCKGPEITSGPEFDRMEAPSRRSLVIHLTHPIFP